MAGRAVRGGVHLRRIAQTRVDLIDDLRVRRIVVYVAEVNVKLFLLPLVVRARR